MSGMMNEDYLKKVLAKRYKKPEEKSGIKDINYNNGMNILSHLDYRVKAKYHEHPLIYCNLPNDPQKYWACNQCKEGEGKYDMIVPCFLCTLCNFFLCQKCFLSFKIEELELLNYAESKDICTHEQMIIKINSNLSFNCDKCKNEINEFCKYCSSCDYVLCKDCMNNSGV